MKEDNFTSEMNAQPKLFSQLKFSKSAAKTAQLVDAIFAFRLIS